MKKIHFICAAFAAALAAASCVKEETVEFGIDTDSIQAGPEGCTVPVKVDVAGRWSADVAEPWILVSPSSGEGSTVCNIRIDSTLLAETRDAKVRINDSEGGGSRLISIVQEGFPKQLTLDETEISLANFASPDERHFEVEVTSNVDFKVTVPDEAAGWLTYDTYTFKLDKGFRPRSTVIRFNWQGNIEENPREATVTFTTDESGLTRHDALKISQDRAPVITDDPAGDSLALVTIENKLNINIKWNHDEPMSYWSGVDLWDASDDECQEHPEMIGRVRGVQFTQSFMKDSEQFPVEFKYLKYLETLSLYSNSNKFNYNYTSIGGIAELKNLKNLQIFSFGFSDFLEEEFAGFMQNLEVLDISFNNLSRIPSFITPEKMPALRQFNAAGNVRGMLKDWDVMSGSQENWGGLYMENEGNSNGESSTLKRMLMFQNLEVLILSNNLIEGTIPDMEDAGLPVYADDDFSTDESDTLTVAAKPVLYGKPKVLPKCRDFRIGRNFFRGELPDWFLYHPYQFIWAPEVSVYNQEDTKDSDGIFPGFTNIPSTYDEYFTYYPVYNR